MTVIKNDNPTYTHINRIIANKNKYLQLLNIENEKHSVEWWRVRKFTSGEYKIIPYGGLAGKSFSIPSILLDLEKYGNTAIEITSYMDGIKLTHYLVLDANMFINDYSVNETGFVFKSHHSNVEYKPPEVVTLYYSTSIDEWKAAIQMGYNKVKSAVDAGETQIQFKYSDVFKGLAGRHNDIGTNVGNGVNKLLELNGIKKKMSLYGYNEGSMVTINDI